MRKGIIWFLVILAVICAFLFTVKTEVTGPAVKQRKKPQRIGEKIIYDVKLGALYLGKVHFNHLANTELNGATVNLMTFETKLAQFNDLETIYSDPQTLLPLRIERGIYIWSKRERIVEDYNQQDFTLNITKVRGNKKEQILIKKDGPIHNTILLPYYVRNMPGLGIGWVFSAKFPTQEFKIKLVSIEDVKVPAGIFNSFRFESTPKRFEIWITTDERRIPVKIKGSQGLGYTLVMKDYSL